MFMEQLLTQSELSAWWFWWLMFINAFSVCFLLISPEARWICAIWVVHIWSLFFYDFFFEAISYWRFISLSQIALWTPLLIYLSIRLPKIPFHLTSGKYIVLAMLSNLIALFLNYRSFALWLAGEWSAQL